EEANGDSADFPTCLKQWNVRPANDLTAKKRVRVTEDRCLGDAIERRERCPVIVRFAGGIDNHELPEDCPVCHRLCRILQYLLKGERIVPEKIDAFLEGLGNASDLLAPKDFNRGGADDNGDLFRVG